MSEQVNAVRAIQDASQFATDWEPLMRAIPATQDALEIPRSKLLAEAVTLLTQHGWDVKMAMSQNAQLEKRTGVRPFTGGLTICIFSIIGMLAVMIQIANARSERINLHVRNEHEGQLQVLHGGKNLVITDLGELADLASSSSKARLGYLAAAGIGLATVIFWALVLFVF